MSQIESPLCVSSGETWRVRRLSTTPYQFYRLTFRSRAASAGYWAVFPFDADGNEMRADTHSSVYASDDWMAHETCFRGLPGSVSVDLGFRAIDGAIEIRDIEVVPVDDDSVRHWAEAL